MRTATLRRKLRAMALEILPKKLAHFWIRQALDLRIPQASREIHFEVASTAEDLKQALSLVQENYQREGYATKTSGSVRLTPYHLLPDSVVIIAKLNKKIVATISVIPRTAFGVPLDNCVALNAFTQNKGKVAEISSLAVDPSIRGEQGEVLFNLMKYMYHLNVEVLKVQTEVIGVNPKMTSLYEAILLFERIPNSTVSSYDFANGAPVVPMFFKLDSAHTSYENIYGNFPSHKNLMKFFLADPPAHFYLPPMEELNQMLPQRNPSQLRDILEWTPDFMRSFTNEQLKMLEDFYHPWPACAQLITEFTNARK